LLRSSTNALGTLDQGIVAAAFGKSIRSVHANAKSCWVIGLEPPPDLRGGKMVLYPAVAGNLSSSFAAMREVSQYTSRPIAKTGIRR